MKPALLLLLLCWQLGPWPYLSPDERMWLRSEVGRVRAAVKLEGCQTQAWVEQERWQSNERALNQFGRVPAWAAQRPAQPAPTPAPAPPAPPTPPSPPPPPPP